MLTVDILSHGESWVLEVCKQAEATTIFIIKECFQAVYKCTSEVPDTWGQKIKTTLGNIIIVPIYTKKILLILLLPIIYSLKSDS